MNRSSLLAYWVSITALDWAVAIVAMLIVFYLFFAAINSLRDFFRSPNLPELKYTLHTPLTLVLLIIINLCFWYIVNHPLYTEWPLRHLTHSCWGSGAVTRINY